jgi:hypothetical protein
MSDRFLNLMRLQAQYANNGRGVTTLGTIIAFNQINFYAMCEIYPADPSDSTSVATTTGWLPIFSPFVGNGWGLFAPVNIGDVVEIHYQEGNLNSGYIGNRCWQLGQNLSVPSGEFWIVHLSGSFIKMTNDGNITISGGTTTTPLGSLNLTTGLAINVTAPTINISGQVNLGNLMSTLTGFLNGSALSVYNSHTHAVTAAPGTTGIPNQQMSGSALSTNVLGN